MKTEKTEASLRDQLAMAALAGGLEQGTEDDLAIDWFHSPTKIAKRAYAIADAMLKIGGTTMTETAPVNTNIGARKTSGDRDTYTIQEFCQAHGGISKSFFHKLVNEGRGPRITKLGHRTLITAEAAAEWRARMEGQAKEVA